MAMAGNKYLRLFIVLFLGIPTISSCEPTMVSDQAFIDNQVDCWWKKNTDTIHFNFEVTQSEESYRLKYSFHDGNLYEYKLDTGSNVNSSLFINGNSKTFKMSDFEIFEINGKRYPVYKFISNYHVDDGCISHFWSPEFGIILIKPSSWCNYKKLVMFNVEKAKELNNLIEMLFLNYKFLYGCLDKMDLRKVD